MQTEGINLIFGIKGLKVHSVYVLSREMKMGKPKDMGLFRLEF
jgi:hypothetical protein